MRRLELKLRGKLYTLDSENKNIPRSLKKEIYDLVSELRKYKKVVAVILFGSHAKKKAKPLSDVDIAVIVKDRDKKDGNGGGYLFF